MSEEYSDDIEQDAASEDEEDFEEATTLGSKTVSMSRSAEQPNQSTSGKSEPETSRRTTNETGTTLLDSTTEPSRPGTAAPQSEMSQGTTAETATVLSDSVDASRPGTAVPQSEPEASRRTTGDTSMLSSSVDPSRPGTALAQQSEPAGVSRRTSADTAALLASSTEPSRPSTAAPEADPGASRRTSGSSAKASRPASAVPQSVPAACRRTSGDTSVLSGSVDASRPATAVPQPEPASASRRTSGDTAALLASSTELSRPGTASGKPPLPMSKQQSARTAVSAAGGSTAGGYSDDDFEQAQGGSQAQGQGSDARTGAASTSAPPAARGPPNSSSKNQSQISRNTSAGSKRYSQKAQEEEFVEEAVDSDEESVGKSVAQETMTSHKSMDGKSEYVDDFEEEPVSTADGPGMEESVASASSSVRPAQPPVMRGNSNQQRRSQGSQRVSRSASQSSSRAGTAAAASAALSVSHLTEESDMVDMRIIQPEPADSPVTLPRQAPAVAAAAAVGATDSIADDSWEGELEPVIVRVQPATQQVTPFRSRPQSAKSRRSTGENADGLSMTSASVVGSLVLMPNAPMGGSGRSRPVSAGMRPQLTSPAVQALLSRHPATWDARDVAEWVTYIGMEQYRKRFLHNCVNGRLLLSMTDQLLKVEIGVGPLGHRAAILEAIQLLQQQAGDDTGVGVAEDHSPTTRIRAQSARPASAPRPNVIPPDPFLGPALGKVTVYDQRAKLLYELDRAAARAAQHRSLVQQLSRTAELSAEEVAHLKGLLADLEKKNRFAVQQPSGSVDVCGRVPWRPASPHKTIMSFGGCMPMTDEPRMSAKSRSLLVDMQGAQQPPTFLERLDADIRRRSRAMSELERRVHAPEVIHNDPLLQKKKERKDHMFVSSRLMDKGLISQPLSWHAAEAEETIVGVLDQCRDVWQIPDTEMAAIVRARMSHKIKLLAAAIRTREFMLRYDTEDADRRSGARQRSLQEKWWISAMGANTKKEKDLEHSAQYFARLGWVGEDAITDGRMGALLTRVSAHKTAYEKWRDQQTGAAADTQPGLLVDFSQLPFSADGLNSLQEAVAARNAAGIDAAAAQAGGVGNLVKGLMAPDGHVQVLPSSTGSTMDYLTRTVLLLARCRWDDIQKMESWQGQGKQLGMYRHIRTQEFIDFTETTQRLKTRKLHATYESMMPHKRVLSKQELDGFYNRLMEDAAKRVETKEREQVLKLEKEAAIIKSSQLYNTRARPRSAR